MAARHVGPRGIPVSFPLQVSLPAAALTVGHVFAVATLAQDSRLPPFDQARALHGAGPFSLLVPADMDADADAELLAADAHGRILIVEPREKAQPEIAPAILAAGFTSLRALLAHDLDRDGSLDVISAGDHMLRWHRKRPAPPDIAHAGNLAFAWDSLDIAPAQGIAACAIADLDRDGDADILAPSPAGDSLLWYRNEPGNEQATIRFEPDIAIDLGAAPLALAAADLNHDAWPDAISLSTRGLGVHLRDPDQPSFSTTFVPLPATQPRHFSIADTDNDADADAVIVADNSLLLATQDEGAWTIRVLDGNAPGARRVHIVDLDSDTLADYLVEIEGQDLLWVRDVGVQPERAAIRLSVRAYGPVVPLDLDRDADIDLVASLPAGALLLRENLSPHRTGVMPRRVDIDPDVPGAFPLIPADLDADGDLDLVSGAFAGDTFSWHENLADSVWPTHELQPARDGPTALAAADLDLDGRVDLVSCSTNDDTIAWHRNLADSPPTFEHHVIASDADAVYHVAIADLDLDARPDVISAERGPDRVRWFRNEEIAGEIVWTPSVVRAGVAGALHVLAADFNADARPDVLIASRDDDTIRLMLNRPGPTFETIVLTTRADEAACVAAADLDRDGDLDALAVSRRDGEVAWFENDGRDTPTFTTRIIQAGLTGATWIRALDIDGDGDQDLAVAVRESDTIHIFESSGTSPPTFLRRSLAHTLDFVSVVEPADLDADGRVDLVATGVGANALALYRNVGGVLALASRSTSPATLSAWSVASVLELRPASRARVGEPDVRPTHITLRFLNDAGAPLSSADANALIRRVWLALDEDDGVFDPLRDREVLAVEPLELLDGSLTLDLPAQDLSLAPGTARTLFVALRMAPRAGLHSTTTFEIIHDETLAGAREILADSPVRLEDARIITTGHIRATCPADLTTSSDPDDPGFGVPDGVVNTQDILYYTTLHNALDPAADLTTTNDPEEPAFAIPDGIVDPADLQFFLDRFSEGC